MHALRERYSTVAIGVTISVLCIGLIIPLASAANEPSHPLSHITPTDSNLNFSDNPNARGYNITHLPWINPYGNRLRIGGVLDMEGNQITGVSALTLGWRNLTDYPVQCPAGYAVQSVGDTLTCTELNVGGQVNSTGGNASEVAFFITNDTITSDPNLYFDSSTYRLGIRTQDPQQPLDVNGTAIFRNNIDMNGTAIRNINALSVLTPLTPGNISDGPGSGLDADTLDGVQLANINWGNVAMAQADIDVSDLGPANANLNMSNRNITNVNEIQDFFAPQCASDQVVSQVYPDGSYNCISVDVASTAENLSDTLGVGNSAGVYDINMNGNNIRNINALSVVQALTDGNISNSITIGSSGSVDPTALNRALNDGEVSDSITIDATGFVNASAVESRIAGNQLTYSNGVLAVNEGSGSGLNADLLDGVELANINWGDVAMAQTDISVADLGAADANLAMNNYNITNLRELTGFFSGGASASETVTGINADGTLQTTGISVGASNVQSGSITASGQELASSVAGDGIALNTGVLDVGAGTGITVNTNDVAVDTSIVPRKNIDETVTANLWTFQNDVQVQGDLDVWGNITNTDVQNLNVNGSILPPAEYDNTFDLGGSGQRWRNAYISQNIYDASGNNFFENTGGTSQTLTNIGSDGSLTFQSISIGTSNIQNGAVTNTKIANGAVNGTQIADFGCGAGEIMYWDGSQWSCTSDDTGSDNQQLGTNNNQITLTNGGQIFAPYANNSDKLDGQEGSFYRNAGNINAGTLGTAYYSAYNDLLADGYFNNNAGSDLLNRSQMDTRFINIGASAGGQLSGTYPNPNIATGAVGNGLTGGGGSTLAVDTVDTTLSVSSSGVDVAAGGIGTNELATAAVTNTRISNGAVNRTQLGASGCSDNQVLKWDNTNNEWVCADDTNTDSQDLSNVLSNGNKTGGQDIDMEGASLRSSGGEMCIGDMCT